MMDGGGIKEGGAPSFLQSYRCVQEKVKISTQKVDRCGVACL
jgi:hypothetical protein